MENSSPETPKAPGIVMFTAVLNFITAGLGAVMIFIGGLGLLFGSVMRGLSHFFQTQVTQYSKTTSMGDVDLSAINTANVMNIILIAILAIGLLITISSVVMGLGLLRGKKWAWYFQVATSVLSLLGFPFWTIVNGVILFCFFQQPTRNYFKV